MASNDLKKLKVAVIIADGFESSEFEPSVEALQNAGAEVEILGRTSTDLDFGIQGMNRFDLMECVKADRLIHDVNPAVYDALLVPGGALSADAMRTSRDHLAFVQNMVDAGKPIAVTSHGGWVLADAGILRGLTMTSWPAIRKDLEHAGAIWKDAEVVQDGKLISSRKPEDIPAFIRAFMTELRKSKATQIGSGEAAA